MACYVVYKGDEVIAIGTAEECAEVMGVKPETVRFYASGAYHKRAERIGRPTIAERVD